VIPAEFDYVRVESIGQALDLLHEHGEDANLLAGGHSLLPMMKLRLAFPSVLIDIGRLPGASYVRRDGQQVVIGALTRHADLVRSDVLRAEAPLIAHAAALVGDPQVRHRGTIGGSVAHGDPASDLTTVLLTLDADFVAQGPDGTRTIAATEFFIGPFDTALARQELLTEVRIPKVAAGTYLKHVRREQDWATVGVAAARVNGRVQIGLTSMGPTPLRARHVEEALAGGASATEAAAHTADGTEPPADVSASSGYRAHLAQVLVERAVAAL